MDALRDKMDDLKKLPGKIKKQGLQIQLYRAKVVAVYAHEICFSSQNSCTILEL